MSTRENRKKRRHRLSQMLFILTWTTVIIATDVLGTIPNNPISIQMRKAFSIVLPAEFTTGLNEELAGYELPTLPPPPVAEQTNFDFLAVLASAPITQATEIAEVTSAPATATNVPTALSTPTVFLTPTPYAPPATEPNLARTWQVFFGSNAETFTVEKQGEDYVITSIVSDFGPAKLISQSWDGDKLNWVYDVNGEVATVETTKIDICGCGELAYVLDASMSIVNSASGETTDMDVTLYPIVEKVPNPDYSGNWIRVENHGEGKSYLTIEKLGDVYIVASVTSDFGNVNILSQSWDGSSLSVTFNIEGNPIETLTTLGVDKDGILLMDTFSESNGQHYSFAWLKQTP
ncbi:MAG: hypothetical protein U0V02_00545 [Anaerolineales bacterium]